MSDISSDEDGVPVIRFNTNTINVPAGGDIVVQPNDGYLVVWYPVHSVHLLGWVSLRYSLNEIILLQKSIIRDGIVSAVATVVAAIILLILKSRKLS